MLLVHWVEPVSQRLGVRTLTQRMLGASLRTVQALVTGAAGSLIWAVESETKRAGLWGSDQRKYVSVGFSISRRVLHGGVCIHVERRPESFAGVENPCGLRREEIGFLSDQFTLAQEGKFLNSWLGSVGEEQLLELLKL
jgi:lipoate-protein ligase B